MPLTRAREQTVPVTFRSAVHFTHGLFRPGHPVFRDALTLVAPSPAWPGGEQVGRNTTHVIRGQDASHAQGTDRHSSDCICAPLKGMLPGAGWRRVLNLLFALRLSVSGPELGASTREPADPRSVPSGLNRFREHLGGFPTLPRRTAAGPS